MDAAKLARKVHNLFRFVQPADPTPAATSKSAPDDPTLLKFAPLFQQYAAVSEVLNAVCVESIRFEKELEKKQGARDLAHGSHRSAARSTPTSAPGLAEGSHSARRRAAQQAAGIRSAASSTASSYDSSSDPSTASPLHSHSLQDSPQHLHAQLLSDESLPLLEVNGLHDYESRQKADEYMHLSSMVRDVAQSFLTLRSLQAQQQSNIDVSETSILAARDKSQSAEKELRQASRYKAFGLVFAGGVTGAAVGGPIGALVGLKTGLSIGVGIGLMGAGGALIGATAAKQIQKARFVPLSHLDEEQEMQQTQSREQAKDDDASEASKASSGDASVASTRASSVASSPADAKRNCSRKCI